MTNFEETMVNKLSDDQLREVLEERKRRRLEARIQRNEELTDIVHESSDVQRFMRMIVPEHSRTSCSDDKRINVGRCTRCDVLNLISGHDLEVDQTIVFYLARDTPED